MYSLLDITDATQWQTLLARAAFPHMTQAWPFGEAKRCVGWSPRRVAITLAGEAVGICQVLYKVVAGIPVAARINQGPLVLDGHQDKELAMHLAIRNHWRFLKRGALLISPAIADTLPTGQILASLGFRRRGSFHWESSRLDLTRTEEDLRMGLKSEWRRNLVKGEKNGLVFTAANDQKEVDWILERHVENMAVKGFEGHHPDLVRGLYDASPNDFFVAKVATAEGEPLAGMVVFTFADVGYFYVGWFGEPGRDLKAGNFLLWNVATELKRRGFKSFDLGGHNGAIAFGKFKMGMNGTGYRTAGEFLLI